MKRTPGSPQVKRADQDQDEVPEFKRVHLRRSGSFSPSPERRVPEAPVNEAATVRLRKYTPSAPNSPKDESRAPPFTVNLRKSSGPVPASEKVPAETSQVDFRSVLKKKRQSVNLDGHQTESGTDDEKAAHQ